MLWLATVLTNTGSWMQNAAAGSLMTSLRPNPFEAALIQAATRLPIFLFSLPAGALADIIGRRPRIIVHIAGVAVAARFAIFVWLNWVTPNWLLIFMSLSGIATVLTMPAWQAIVPQLVPKEEPRSAVAPSLLMLARLILRGVRVSLQDGAYALDAECRFPGGSLVAAFMQALTVSIRLWTGDDNNSNFEEGRIDLPNGEHGDILTGTVNVVSISFRETRAGGAFEWGDAPVRQLVITLRGTLDFQTRTGEHFILHRATSLLAEDTVGTGAQLEVGRRQSLAPGLRDP